MSVHHISTITPAVSPLEARLNLSRTEYTTSYNSVVYSSVSATDYLAIRVDQRFLDGEVWNADLSLNSSWAQTLPDLVPKNNLSTIAIRNKVSMLQSRAHTLSRLESAACNNTYGSILLSDWRNVLIVSNSIGFPDSSDVASINIHLTDPSPINDFCESYRFPYEPPIVYNNETGTQCGAPCPKDTICLSVGPLLYSDEKIDYCLAEVAESHCKLYFSTSLLFVVLLCNAVKLFCLFLTLTMAEFDPLITIGDAIASFMSSPEELTANLGALTYDDFQRMEIIKSLGEAYGSSIKATRPRPWDPQQRRWLHGKTGSRWDVGLIL